MADDKTLTDEEEKLVKAGEDAKASTEKDDEAEGKPETDEPKEESEDAPSNDQDTTQEPEESEEKAEPKEEATAEEKPDAPEKPLTRKEKREERRQSILEAARKQNARTYKPREIERPELIDYRNAGEEGFDPDDLVKDRQQAAKIAAEQAAEEERWKAEQVRYADSLAMEEKLLAKDPDFKFLDENDPDSFDEDKAGFIRENFALAVGYDPESMSFGRTDLSFEQYARTMVSQMKDWASEAEAKAARNAAARQSKAGVRPTAAQKGPRLATPQDIRNMSDEEYEKHKEEISKRGLDYLKQAE